MSFDEEIRDLILSSRSVGRLRESARRAGMKSLAEDGWRLVGAGETSIDEVMRVTRDEQRNGRSNGQSAPSAQIQPPAQEEV